MILFCQNSWTSWWNRVSWIIINCWIKCAIISELTTLWISCCAGWFQGHLNSNNNIKWITNIKLIFCWYCAENSGTSELGFINFTNPINSPSNKYNSCSFFEIWSCNFNYLTTCFWSFCWRCTINKCNASDRYYVMEYIICSSGIWATIVFSCNEELIFSWHTSSQINLYACVC